MTTTVVDSDHPDKGDEKDDVTSTQRLPSEDLRTQNPPKMAPNFTQFGGSGPGEFFFSVLLRNVGARGSDWSEPGEYNILFLGSVLVISSQDSSALGYREFTQEGP